MSRQVKKEKERRSGSEPATDAAILAALEKSGYLLESRIEKLCLAARYEVHASRRILDPIDNVPREMDLLAELREVRLMEQVEVRPSLGASLIIECKNNWHPVAFLEKPVTWEEQWHVPTLFGVPLNVPEKVGASGFAHLEDQARVAWRWQFTHWATQFCNFNWKGNDGELEACQNPDFHGTFEKLLVAAESIADEVMSPAMVEAGVLGGHLHLIRPVIVLQGRLVSVIDEGKKERLEDREHMRYLRKSVLYGRRFAWVVDVVTESGFPEYLAWVNKTLRQVESYCLEHRDVVQDAFKNRSTRQLALSMRAPSR